MDTLSGDRNSTRCGPRDVKEVAVLLTSSWREWYHFRHQQECFKSGTAFEAYVTSALDRFHDDFVNPSPAGTMGDGGCDGLAESGTILYACYGQRPGRDAERELKNKLESDFARGLASWGTFTTWRFVTNAPAGTETIRSLTALQQAHGPEAHRPLTLRLWNPQRLWDKVVGRLEQRVLNELFPGAPGIENVELADLIPLLDRLGEAAPEAGDTGGRIPPVPITKMDHNDLAEGSRVEFNAGRVLAPRIERWYAEHSDPDLSDRQGDRFRTLYGEVRARVSDPTEILERLYVSLAGTNFRMDAKRANAAYAVVAYFFDSCHIFETPPEEGTDLAASN